MGISHCTSSIRGTGKETIDGFARIQAKSLVSSDLTATNATINRAVVQNQLSVNATITNLKASTAIASVLTASTINIDKDIVFDKASGIGIKINTATPVFGWRDILGTVAPRNPGATKPTHATYRGGLQQFQFGAGDEEFYTFHVPHDYAAGTDMHIHVHWSHTATLVTGGTVTWKYEAMYAKGYNQAAFATPVLATWAQNAAATQYQHMIAETQLSATNPSAVQLNTNNFEPDGIIEVRIELDSNDITVSVGGVPEPFIHEVDLHYQSTGIGTNDKNVPFYS